MGITGCWPVLWWLGGTQGRQAPVVRVISFYLSKLFITISVHVATSIRKVLATIPVGDTSQNMSATFRPKHCLTWYT